MIDPLAMLWDTAFLALMLWREARGESLEAKLAVASTVIHRVNNPGWWGQSVVGVLKKKWQYSSLTDPQDSQLTVWPDSNDRTWQECLQIASDVLQGRRISYLNNIDSYYDDSLQGDKVPKWAREHPECFVGKIGRLNFYRMGHN